MPDALRLFLVDDHPLVRDGIRAHLELSGHRVCGEAASPQDALLQLRRVPVDLLITDMRLASGSGMDVLTELARERSDLPVLVLTMLSEPAFVQRVMSAGALGYVLKDDAGATLLQAIATIAAGGVFLSPSLAPGDLNLFRDRPHLSPRELDVLRMLADGASSKAVSEHLGLSVRTVESHRLRLRRKLHLEGAGSLARYAQDYAALEPVGPTS
ncbi:hypothetical protein CCO03_15635 [Comamonas serinivorans]|uniref:DNA-binding response regulator n=1 Tax=Comamonas serinivorans TaxID=1082851 RepID=A0A1Y0EQN3_9BURK|nr:response regulator transcription factor [Comamonas serinivorans]ARU05913.1 hypothetical protein CCO03_15635 [Comamonas serinivorans]